MKTQEKDTRLKYFYLIDTEKICENIIKKSSHKTASCFDLIFSEIMKTADTYLKFITSNDSFNNPKDYNKNYQGIVFLLKETLKNHCVLHGFFTAVYNKDKSSESIIKISGANDYYLKKGYFNTKYFEGKTPPDKNSKDYNDQIFQIYNQYRSRFELYSESLRSYKILKKYNIGDLEGFLNVYKHNGNWACFIYTNCVTPTFDKNINTNSKRLLINYEKLLEECMNWCNSNNLSVKDRILFENAMESIYGFSFFIYAAQLLQRIHETPFGTDNPTLKDLEGSLMLNLIQETARLPILHNRSIFLEYALCSVLSSKSLRKQNHRISNNSLFEDIAAKTPDTNQLILSGLNDIDMYLKKLKFAIPLLEDLWDVVTDKLNQKYAVDKLNLDTYCSYIESNYPKMAQDYSYYFKDEQALTQLNQEPQLCCSVNEKDMLQKKSCFKDSLSSKYIRESFESILSKYFDNTEQTSSTQGELYNRAVLYPNSSVNKSKFSNELNFLNAHAKNILSFAENIL